MKLRNNRTGLAKALIYVRICLHVAGHYLVRPAHWGWNPARYLQFLRRALQLLLIFRHHKVVRVINGFKIHLYLPTYPSAAFFHAVESKLLRRPPGPITVVYSMTKACAYRCPHCYQRHDGGSDLDEALLLRVATQLCDSGVAMFDIEGGEPFLRYDRLLALVKALGDRAEVWVNTIGQGVTRERLMELKGAGLFGLMVSVHSPERETHDRFTGTEGSFETACRTLRLCDDCGLTTAINSVLSEAELRAGRLDELMALAGELGCRFVQLIHPKPAGAWLGQQAGMQVDPELLARIRQAHLAYNSGAHREAPALAAQAFEEAPEILGCTAGGVDRFYVNANGEVQPCEFLNLSFGNLNEEPWIAIYRRMRSHFPQPCTDWLCCTQAGEIRQALASSTGERTPLPWPETEKLVATWNRGPQTPLYKGLGIYR